MTVKSVFYTFWLITQPDIMSDQMIHHMITFESQKNCMELAELLGQTKTPIFDQKKNCRKTIAWDTYYHVPLTKPEGFDALLRQRETRR